MSRFKPGDRVDITIKGVRLDDENADGTVNIIAQHSDGGPATWHMPPQAKVEHAEPADWPPQPGDLWKDASDTLWFATGNDLRGIALYADGRGEKFPQAVRSQQGPLTLVYRKERS